MNTPKPAGLSRRERQIMDIVYQRGTVTVGDVLEHLADPPSYSAVRSVLRILEQRGQVRHVQDGSRYVYLPTVPRRAARRTALAHLLRTFFDGSAEGAVAALLDMKAGELDDATYDRLATLIERARREGR